MGSFCRSSRVPDSLQEIVLKGFTFKLQQRELLVHVTKNNSKPASLHVTIFQEWIADKIKILAFDGEIDPAANACICTFKSRRQKSQQAGFQRGGQAAGHRSHGTLPVALFSLHWRLGIL